MKQVILVLLAGLAVTSAVSTAEAKPLQKTTIYVAVGKFNPAAKFDWVKINPQPLPPKISGGQLR